MTGGIFLALLSAVGYCSTKHRPLQSAAIDLRPVSASVGAEVPLLSDSANVPAQPMLARRSQAAAPPPAVPKRLAMRATADSASSRTPITSTMPFSDKPGLE